jgi:hypothetical protein
LVIGISTVVPGIETVMRGIDALVEPASAPRFAVYGSG